MLLCPNSFETVYKSAPRDSSSVAKVCRAVWNDTRLCFIPAAKAHFLILSDIDELLIGLNMLPSSFACLLRFGNHSIALPDRGMLNHRWVFCIRLYIINRPLSFIISLHLSCIMSLFRSPVKQLNRNAFFSCLYMHCAAIILLISSAVR